MSVVKQKHPVASDVKSFLGAKSNKLTRAEILKLYWNLIKKKGLKLPAPNGRYHIPVPGLEDLVKISDLLKTVKVGSKSVRAVPFPAVMKLVSRLLELK